MDKQSKYILIQKLIQTEDDEALEHVRKILESVEIVGYELNGTPITKRNFNEKIKDAQGRVSSGEFITQDDLEKESEQW